MVPDIPSYCRRIVAVVGVGIEKLEKQLVENARGRSWKENFGQCFFSFRCYSLSFPNHQPLSEPCKKWSRVSDKFELICPYSDWSPSSRQVQFENSSFWSRRSCPFSARTVAACTTSRHQMLEKTSIWSLSICQKAVNILFLHNGGLMELSSGKGFQLFFEWSG